MDISLHTDGPHSPDYTAEVGNALAEAVRVLNYATRRGEDGLEYPGDAYTLLGNLHTATSRLPQLLAQVTEFLDGWQASGQLASSDGDPSMLAARAAFELGEAHTLARNLTSSLQAAQNAIASLSVVP